MTRAEAVRWIESRRGSYSVLVGDTCKLTVSLGTVTISEVIPDDESWSATLVRIVLRMQRREADAWFLPAFAVTSPRRFRS